MELIQEIKATLIDAIKKAGIKVNDVSVTFSDRADFQCNDIFALAKQNNISPIELAQNIVSSIISPNFTFSVAAPAFININVSNERLNKELNTYASNAFLGIKRAEKPLTVVMDYGGANVAKELHVGHLRSPIIGEALARLYKLLGHKVISDSHLGDWGLQMGLTVAQMHEDGYIDGFFDKTKKNKEITLDTLNEEYPKASARKKTDIEFKKKAEDYTLYIQTKKEPYYSVYEYIRDISIEKIKKNYADLNCYFDLWYGESTAEPFMDKIVNIFVDKKIARKSDGALIVDVAEEGENIPTDKKDANGNILYKNPMPPVIIKKFNGADMYATSDIATIYMRNQDYNPDKILYIVDFRQETHFKQVFRAAKLAGISGPNQELLHIAYGTINGKDGKAFKTREGTTIKLDDIISLLKNKAKEKLEQNGIFGNDELAREIGVAALKFGDLSNAVNKDYVFDIDRFSSFDGKTGPYIQYTAARINSLLEKANMKPGVIDITTQEERNIAMNILKLNESYYKAYKENSLQGVCSALYNLTSSFSLMYNNIRINTAESDKKQKYLSIIQLVHRCIAQCLYVLAIDMPEKM